MQSDRDTVTECGRSSGSQVEDRRGTRRGSERPEANLRTLNKLTD